MNYFLLDFSGTNATAPTEADYKLMDDLGITWSHDYGMSFSSDPRDFLDLFNNARTTMSIDEFREALSSMRYPPKIEFTNPDSITIRGRTVREELDAAEIEDKKP